MKDLIKPILRLKLQELQEANNKAQELKQQNANGYKKIDEIFYQKGLPFVPKAIWTKLISHYDNNFLADYFGIEKIYRLLAQKYYWPTLHHDVKAYIKGCDVYLVLKAVHHKPYSNFQLLPIPMHQ